MATIRQQGLAVGVAVLIVGIPTPRGISLPTENTYIEIIFNFVQQGLINIIVFFMIFLSHIPNKVNNFVQSY